MPARTRSLLAIAVSLALAGTALGAHLFTVPEPAPKELVLADFEKAAPPSSFGELEPLSSRKSRGSLTWRREPCRRSGAAGHCLSLRYRFVSAEDEDLAFRIDLGDLDASDYDHLEFWLRGDETEGFNETLKIGFRRPKSDIPGMMEDGTQVVSGITAEWRRVIIPLNRLSGIGDWTHLRSFFVSLESRRAAVRKGRVHIDDIVLLKTNRPGPSILDEVAPVKKRAWEEALGGREAARPHVQARLSGWPERLLVDRQGLPETNREFLMRVARDTWRGVDALTDRENGLPIDHVTLANGSLSLSDFRIGDYTNVTNIGLRFLSVVAAYELEILSADEAVHRARRLLDTLERLERHEGFFFNYYDTTSLERTSNFVSFVDSSWLTAGLMVLRMTFPALYDRCTSLIEAGNYGFFYDDVKQQMSHGYYVNVPTWSEYHYGVVYTEARLGSLIAIGKGEVPEEHWFRLLRTFPPEARWQTQKPKARKKKTVRGHRFKGGYYEWNGSRYVPSWGGSMFEALMPTLVLDEPRYAPKSLGRNDETHAALQRRYATEHLGYPVWGLSPGAQPDNDGYAEYGVKVLGSLGYPAGAVTPYAAALALSVMPEAATADLRKLVELYDIYGEYGFYDAVNPRNGKVAYEYLALDQLMTFISAANALKNHCVQERFASDPIAKRALPILRDENFLNGRDETNMSDGG